MDRKNGSLVPDSICKRIDWLINNYLEQIAVNSDNWSALYKEPSNENYWGLSYPQSHMHGGGPPMLRRISKDHVNKMYNIDLI